MVAAALHAMSPSRTSTDGRGARRLVPRITVPGLFVLCLASCAEPLPVLQEIPDDPDGPRITSLTGGSEHTCALDEDGGAWCWGANTNGELGDGGGNDQPGPMRVELPAPLRMISAGTRHTCGIQEDGVVVCWGENSFGQLGRDDTSSSAPAAVVGLPPVAGVSAGTQHTCAWTEDGEAFCWGDNSRAQLGDGTMTTTSEPTAVVGDLLFTDIRAGLFSTCGVTDELLAYCWGDNGWGVARGHDDVAVTTPAEVQTGTDVASFALGQDHACLRTAAGAVFCWGGNDDGQLGTGDTEPWEELVEPLPAVSYGSVVSGPRSAHSCAVSVEARAYCWGRNDAGQTSYPVQAFGIAPALLVRGLIFTKVTVGRAHTCALGMRATVYCWGENQRGQLGRGAEAALTATSNIDRVEWPES